MCTLWSSSLLWPPWLRFLLLPWLLCSLVASGYRIPVVALVSLPHNKTVCPPRSYFDCGTIKAADFGWPTNSIPFISNLPKCSHYCFRINMWTSGKRNHPIWFPHTARKKTAAHRTSLVEEWSFGATKKLQNWWIRTCNGLIPQTNKAFACRNQGVGNL